MQKIILLQIIAIAISYVSLNDEQHCDCQELDQNDCELIPYWCSWNNETCISHNQNCETFIDYDTCLFKGSHCSWITNSTHQYCQTQNSSDYTTSLDCLSRKFYWFNETCSENFTKCDDYSTDDCSYLKQCEILDDKCIDYQFQNCTDDKNCLDRYTSSDYTHRCLLVDEKCYKIEIYNPCISFNDQQILCELYSDCLYEDPKCRLRTCSDILDSTECDNYKAKENGNDVLCEWKDEKCQNMIEITKLDEDTCFTSTSYNYIWKDKKCELCPNLKSNTPKYEPISHTNITNETQPNTTEIKPTDPVIIDLNNRCACSVFDTYDSCEERNYCYWDYETYKCLSFYSSCDSITNQIYCEFSGCVWDSNRCEKFTQCSDYYSTSCPLSKGCYRTSNNNKCQPFDYCENIDVSQCPEELGCVLSSYSCQKSSSCSSYSKDDCEGKYEQRNYPCYLDNDENCKSKFTVVKFQICEDFDDSKTHCELMEYCVYIDNKCIKGKCYHFSKDECYHQRNSNGTYHLCHWDYNSNQCGYKNLSTSGGCNHHNLKTNYYYTCEMCQTYELEDLHTSQYPQQTQQSYAYFGNIIFILLTLIY